MQAEALTILYRDDSMVAIHKPAGYLVHPASDPHPDDLVAMKILRDQIGERVHSIHRLDRPTAGVLLFGIDLEVSRALHLAFKEHQVEKTYWAVIKGKPEHYQWTCDEPIQKEKGAPVRDALTDFKLLKSKGELSLIEAIPKTGRFHQIRRHLLASGNPIVGDYRYAGIEESDANGEKFGTGTRMLLTAKSLRLKHPLTGEQIEITTSDPLVDGLFE